MFCKNCGKEIKDGTKFCEFCGAGQENVQPIEQSSTAAVTKKKSKKKIFIIIGVILAIIIIWAACGNKSSKKENNQIEMTTEMSKYTKTNSYGISCNGNSDLAIEAANNNIIVKDTTLCDMFIFFNKGAFTFRVIIICNTASKMHKLVAIDKLL